MAAQLREKRSSNNNYLDDHLQTDLFHHGVGARQDNRSPSQEGGGYLDICTDSEVDLKAQLRELALMGVSKTWLNVAEAVGVPAFLKIWQVLDQQAGQGAEIGSSVRVTVPQFGRYLRYQRNQVIRSMANDGSSSTDIQKYLLRNMGLDIHIRTIQRVTRK